MFGPCLVSYDHVTRGGGGVSQKRRQLLSFQLIIVNPFGVSLVSMQLSQR